ncbi:MAG: BamA/TamA family outer membrane protein [Muribaculaceae bacterium]|nr:BamA/TamA family outer membrane protein [Muribaculaceae bacterium]
MRFRFFSKAIIIFLGAILLWNCSSTKHVPAGKYLVDEVSINIEDTKEVSSSDLYNYLRQVPNHKVLGFLKLQLATYNLSGRDSTKWYNRWFQKLGQAPVIYDPLLTDISANQLKLAMVNRGFLGASVSVDTITRPKKKKIDINYTIHAGEPHKVTSVTYDIPDTAISKIVLRDSSRFAIRPGELLNRDVLDANRSTISQQLRNHGYFTFAKDYITYTADTVAGSKGVDLTMTINPPKIKVDSSFVNGEHESYLIRNVYFVTNYQPMSGVENLDETADTVTYKGIKIIYGKDRYLSPQALEEKCFIDALEPYNSSDIDRTYEALSRFEILKYINIEMKPVGKIMGQQWLDAHILLSRGKLQGVTVELEGTNSEGDLGFGIGATYKHRNLARGSQVLTTKFRMAYESLSGDLEGLINDRYTEFAGEVGVKFPKFMAPVLSKDFKQRMNASTEFALSFNYQERPEYTRIIAGGAWKYIWADRRNTERSTFDLIDLNYVYLPNSTLNFVDQITNPILRYSYEDHFIMKMGYSYYRTNKRQPSTSTFQRNILQPRVYTLRASSEIAGNLLYAISSIAGQEKDNGVYKVFGTQYSQYFKGDVDYTLNFNLNPRHSFAFHAGVGIGVPYGNSKVLPFEKRFYSGGANSVRGWGVRTLGPGTYNSRNSMDNFINQCGDIRLDLNLEYRAKLFWVIEGGLFIDAGNIWTIREYENQPGGAFHFNSFYKEIALAYGAGIRLDFDFFLLRFDLGMKAHNPAKDQERWPIIRPNWKRDATFHFSVGYPF